MGSVHDIVYPEMVVEAELNSVWTDITEDIIQGSIYARWGISGDHPSRRVAGPGTLTFKLRNDEWNSAQKLGYYSPDHANARTGWDIGVKVRLTFSFDGQSSRKFYGKIPPNGIKVTPGAYNAPAVMVSVVDWMDKAQRFKIRTPTGQTNVAPGAGIQAILDIMGEEPLNKDLATGESIYPTLFDTVRKDTFALQEMARVTNSEPGYLYIKRDRAGGETLVFEGRFDRSVLTQADRFPLPSADSGRLLKEDGGYLLLETGGRIILDETLEAEFFPLPAADSGRLLKEDGGYLLLETGGKIILDQTTPALFSENMLIDSPDTSRASLLFNSIEVVTNPREIDAAATTILFTLQSPILIEAGQSLDNIKFNYRNPVGGSSRVAGTDIQDLVPSTDYKMNTAEDGSGTDITSSLTVTMTKGTEGVLIDFENTGSVAGYIWVFQVVGKGIYFNDPVRLISEDQDSIDAHGFYPLRFNLSYQSEPNLGIGYANNLLSRYKDPQTIVNSFRWMANRDPIQMMAFLFLDVGSRFYASESVTAVAENFYINAVEFTVLPGNVIMYSWHVANADFSAFWVLSSSALSVNTALAYG